MNHNRSNIFRNIARYGCLVLSILLIVFTLLSGSEAHGGGIEGIIKNSPNAFPWFILLVFTVIAWKNELVGGILIILFGIWMVYFLNFSGPNFWWITFFISVMMPLLGVAFIFSWYLRRQLS